MKHRWFIDTHSFALETTKADIANALRNGDVEYLQTIGDNKELCHLYRFTSAYVRQMHIARKKFDA